MGSFHRVALLLVATILVLSHSICQVSALKPREVTRASNSITQRPEYQALHKFVDDYLKSQIPLTDITILLPANVVALQSYTKDQQTAILSYNVIATRYLFKNLTDIPAGTELDTLEGNILAKRGPAGQPVVTFKGAGGLPTALVLPNLWVGSDFTIHGTSTLLMPPDLAGGSAASSSSKSSGIVGSVGGAVSDTARCTIGTVSDLLRGASGAARGSPLKGFAP